MATPWAARKQVNIAVEPAVYADIERRARGLNIAPGTYVRTLFEAAYAARVGQERGMPASEPELDACVRLVFALAGQADTKAIAKATGVPAELVAGILQGFAKAGKARAA